MNTLYKEKCEPCQGTVPTLTNEEISVLQPVLHHDWNCVEMHHLYRAFHFADFVAALAFVNAIAVCAEENGHHPDIELGWGYVRVKMYTHKIDGLSRADFVLAAKIDRLEINP